MKFYKNTGCKIHIQESIIFFYSYNGMTELFFKYLKKDHKILYSMKLQIIETVKCKSKNSHNLQLKCYEIKNI